MAMLYVNDAIRIPLHEFAWTFVRAGGPGGQNVNKVASKAVLRWDMAGSPSVPGYVKARLRALVPSRITLAGELVLASQRYRDQERNRQACLEKLRAIVARAAVVPLARKATRPTLGSHQRRLAAKKNRARVKLGRRVPGDE